MGILRKLTTKYLFLSGSLQIVKITEVNNDEMLCSDGTRIPIKESWRDHLTFLKSKGSDTLSYRDTSEIDDGISTVLRNGQFIGILVRRAMVYEAEYGDTPQIVGMNVTNGAHYNGWFSGDINDYCRRIVATDFVANAEWLLERERKIYGNAEEN